MKKLMIILMVALSLLTACAAQTQPCTTNMRETVKNIFTVPPTACESSVPSTPCATTPTSGNHSEIPLGNMSFGPSGTPLRDESGVYRLYEGGQMHLPFEIMATGQMITYDVGVLIFIDGIAQPYRVGPDGEYAYLHTFSQEDGTQVLGTTTTIADIYLTPVTGQQGDILEVYAITILQPNHVPSQGMLGFALTGGSVVSTTRLKFDATPPEETYPEKPARLLEMRATTEDCTAEDVLGWSNTDLIENQAYFFSINNLEDKDPPYVYHVRENEPLRLRFEVWGTPYVHYGLVIFVDNVPVCAADCTDIRVSVEMGQKTVIEAKLDMSGFAGESTVYAVLVPRNCRTSEIPTNASLCASRAFYLLAKEKDA